MSPISRYTAGFILAGCFFSSVADAGLLWDLRAVSISGGSGEVVGPKTFTRNASAGPGTVITLELWVVVTGADGILNETFQTGLGTILSSPGTLPNRDPGVVGNLVLASYPTTQNLRGNISNTLLVTWQTAASSNGVFADLDGDGDLDVGSNNTSPSSSYFMSRAASPQDGTGLSPDDFHTLPDGREFKISVATFTVASLGPAGSLALNFVVPSFSSSFNENARASFSIDGVVRNGADDQVAVGAPVVLGIPEPSCATLFVAGLGFAGLRRGRRGEPAF